LTPKDPYVASRCVEIELLLADAKGWAAHDEKLGAHLAAYLTVLITGVVEDCIEHLVLQTVSKTQDHEVRRFVGEVLGQRFRNPDWGKISGLLRQFSEEYQRQFTARIPHNSPAADALTSIVSYKNDLSHVGTWKLQLTVAEVDSYNHSIIPILEALEDILT